METNLESRPPVGPTKLQLKALPESEALPADSGSAKLSSYVRDVIEWMRSGHQRTWIRMYDATRFYNGDQWRVWRKRGLSMNTFNIIGPHCDIIASNMTDAQIGFKFIPKGEDAHNMAEVHEEIARQFVEQENKLGKDYQVVLDSQVKGYGIVKIGHDPRAGIPVSYEVISPFNFMAEPGVKRPDLTGNVLVHFEWMTVMDVYDLWGRKADKVLFAAPEEAGGDENYDLLERGGQKQDWRVTPVYELYIRSQEREPIPEEITAKQLENEHRDLGKATPAHATVDMDHKAHHKAHMQFATQQAEIIMQQLKQMEQQMAQQAQAEQKEPPPASTEEEVQRAIINHPIIRFVGEHIEDHVDLFEENPDGDRPKYNGWQRVVAAGPDYRILDNGPSPYVDEKGRGEHPFHILPAIQNSGDIYGLSTVERAMPSQEMVNRWVSKIEDHINHSSNPMLVINVAKCPYPPNQIKSLAGVILPVDERPDDVLKWMAAPQIGSEVIRFLSQTIRQIEVITGVSDVEMGVYPRMERASQPMIQQIAEHGRARWRAYHREYANWNLRVMKSAHNRWMQYMKGTRQLRIAGAETRLRTINQYMLQDGGGLEVLEDLSHGRWDLQIEMVPMSTLTQEAKMEKGLRLFGTFNKMGIAALDGEGLAEYLDMPEIKRSFDRQMAMIQQMQETEQAQEGGGGPSGPPATQ